MKNWIRISCLFLAVLLLSGCSMLTVNEMYCLPKRSEDYNNLQAAMDDAMRNLSYCAPLSGDNLQAVQKADLDGDGVEEYLIFAKSETEKPLRVLIFQQVKGVYQLVDTIQSTGSGFDEVEYARVDDKPGYELIVGRQVSDQVTRALTAYHFEDGKAITMMNANYTKFVTCDLNADGRTGMLVLHPGESDEANGIAEVFHYSDGAMERSNQMNMSQPVSQIKRIVYGKLHGGQPAVYVASAVGESAIITDVFALRDDMFTNVTFSNESGTSVQTLRNYFVFADDIDGDGIIELPDLITMRRPDNTKISGMQYLIRWYAMTAAGEEIDKAFTYHDFQAGWYMDLPAELAPRIAVVQRGDAYEFYLWDEAFTDAEKMFTVYALTGADRNEQAISNNRFVLYKTDTTVYAANLEVASADYGVTQEVLSGSFRLIRGEWKNG